MSDNVEMQKLAEDARQAIYVQNNKALKILKKLDQLGKKSNNNEARGYAHYYYAFWYYYMDPKPAKFRIHVSEAIKYLLRTDNTLLLANAYNFVAVDANNNGSFDVAYQYYMTALDLEEKDSDSLMSGVLFLNIGRILFLLENYNDARRYMRKSIKIINKYKTDYLYYQNIFAAYVNDGFNSLALNDLKGCDSSLSKLEKIIEKNKDSLSSDVVLPYTFLKASVAIREKNKNNIDQLLRETIESLKQEKQVPEYIEYLHDFCFDLLENNYLDYVGEIIEAIRNQVENSDITYVRRLYVEIEIAYYEATKQVEKLNETILVEHTLLQRQREEQKSSYKISIDLIRMAKDIQDEKEALDAENAELQKQASTDILTGIPNRFAMNVALEEAFEKAYQNRSLLGVEIIDLDGFKGINDAFGHQVGDECLKIIGHILKDFSNENNIFVSRYGGDEFVIIYEGLTSQEIEKHAKDLYTKINSSPIIFNGESIPRDLVPSQGICNTIPNNKNKVWDILTEADMALYELKKNKDDSNRIRLRNNLSTFME